MKNLIVPLLVCALTATAEARVRLTTLPARERIAVRFEDTGDVLVEESRTLTLDKGLNQVDFTWLGVNIDRSSVQLLPVAGKGPTVLRTTYPPAEPTSLVWEVAAPQAGPVPVRIAYLLKGLTRSLAWRVVAEEPAKGKDPKLSMKLVQRLVNESGEDLDEAELRAAFGEARSADLASGEVRQQNVLKFPSVAYEKRYTSDPDRAPEVSVDYVVANTERAGLGRGLLPGGKVRLFQQTGETEAFLGEDVASGTPLGEELVLRVGTARDITVRRATLETRREIIRRDKWNNPTLSNEISSWRWEVENFTGEERTVRLVQRVAGEWDVTDPVQTLERRLAPEKYEPAKGESQRAAKLEREDAQTLVVHLPVPPGRRVVFTANVRRLNLH